MYVCYYYNPESKGNENFKIVKAKRVKLMAV